MPKKIKTERKVAYEISFNVEVRKVSYELDSENFVTKVRSEGSPDNPPYDLMGLAFHVSAKTPTEASEIFQESLKALLNEQIARRSQAE